ncbi:hypothetical protein [Desulforamulus aeronauticus]|uniref:Uncharacterized protein n=1 Tax=Desulforamulus aeronauticus DSM 10349 TaxID=1121421 RepID=A0A1M6PVC5_9FIRM|nr:hypothetical protein [Desulforamulus aeronauticus]SHK11867.1 hypothetical protein SAMN02745123_00730 [Desulforamulus aeronauticus DSM 10349]
MFTYALLNENNICIGYSHLSGEVIDEKMVRMNDFDDELLYRKYVDGRWSDEKYETQSTALNSLRRKVARLISK